ncbi:uncharacterized protein LOC124165577 [Ischnura elegans]|uniref:uncharacterized protein LOC124165577 n=1 Tax=Ischnura elegans TaxID=197161 RepID=UPI001ED86CE5|nr:uncharacterized protein LOC124165577 [Ischnura elegans]
MGTGGGPYTKPPNTDPLLEMAVPYISYHIPNTGDSDNIDYDSSEGAPSPSNATTTIHPSTSSSSCKNTDTPTSILSPAPLPPCTSPQPHTNANSEHHPATIHPPTKRAIVNSEFDARTKRCKVICEGEEEILKMRKEAALMDINIKKIELEIGNKKLIHQEKIQEIELRDKMEEYALNQAIREKRRSECGLPPCTTEYNNTSSKM